MPKRNASSTEADFIRIVGDMTYAQRLRFLIRYAKAHRKIHPSTKERRALNKQRCKEYRERQKTKRGK